MLKTLSLSTQDFRNVLKKPDFLHKRNSWLERNQKTTLDSKLCKKISNLTLNFG